MEMLRVDKYATVTFATNRYSVPDSLVGHRVFAKIYSRQILIYDEKLLLCTHSRLYGRNQWQIDLQHYFL